jgi:hypothetical protein
MIAAEISKNWGVSIKYEWGADNAVMSASTESSNINMQATQANSD